MDLVFGCSDETGERALAEVRRLVEKEHVEILVGAETSAAGIAIRDYAKTQPDTTFLIALAPTAEATSPARAERISLYPTRAPVDGGTRYVRLPDAGLAYGRRRRQRLLLSLRRSRRIHHRVLLARRQGRGTGVGRGGSAGGSHRGPTATSSPSSCRSSWPARCRHCR